MRGLLVCGVGVGLAISIAAFETRADEPVNRAGSTARLRVASPAAAASCPDELALARRVDARGGRRLVDPDATLTVDVAFGDGDAGALIATLKLTEGDRSLGERTIAARHRDCAALGEAVAVAIAVALDPDALVVLPDAALPPITSSKREPAPEPTPIAGASRSSRTGGGHRPKPAAPESLGPVRARARIGVLGALGAAPAETGGLVAGVGLRLIESFSLSLEGRADLPVGREAAVGSAFLGEVAPCAHVGPFAPCALFAVGAFRGASAVASQITPYVELGARASLELELVRPWGAALFFDGLAPLTPTELRLDGARVWRSPPVSLALGVAATFEGP